MRTAPAGRIGGNTNTTLLKIIALVFMFIDHAGKMCFPQVPEMRMLGRIAFPLYCWCLVVGANYTRSFPKYLLRMGLIGLVSQPLYMVALNHPWNKFNIFLTLFIALCALWGLRAKRFGSHIWAPVLALIAAEVTGADYGWKGVLLTILLWAAREKRGAIAAVMAAFCLYWGSGSSTVSTVFGVRLSGLLRAPLSNLITPWLKLQGLAVLATPLMVFPLPGKIKMPHWLSYAIYPAHLLLLILLEYAMSRPVHWEHLANALNQFIALF